MMGKLAKWLRKNKVQLIGQVTGANGKLLQQAIDLIQKQFCVKKI